MVGPNSSVHPPEDDPDGQGKIYTGFRSIFDSKAHIYPFLAMVKDRGFRRKFDFDCQHHWAHRHGRAEFGGLGKRSLPGSHHAISAGQQQQCDPSICPLGEICDGNGSLEMS